MLFLYALCSSKGHRLHCPTGDGAHFFFLCARDKRHNMAFLSVDTFPHLRTHPQFAKNAGKAPAGRELFPHLRQHGAFSARGSATETAVFGAG